MASGIFGSHSTLGDETVLSALYGRASVSVGQFHYETKGFRPNNDQTHNVYNAFMQFAVTPRFNVQAEVRTRKTEQGDILIDFDPNNLFSKKPTKIGRGYSTHRSAILVVTTAGFDCFSHVH